MHPALLQTFLQLQKKKKTGLSRATIREWLADAEIIQKQVDDVKVLGSSNKYGGMEKRKRIRVMAPLNSQVENALLVYFDNRCDENLPISRKLLMKQSVKIARELEFRDFKGSKGYIHRFLRRNDVVPRTFTGSGQQIPHDAQAQCLAFISDLGKPSLI